VIRGFLATEITENLEETVEACGVSVIDLKSREKRLIDGIK
jgi:hypothetical protein